MIDQKQLQTFAEYLYQEEKSAATIDKYLRDVRNLQTFIGTQELSKELILSWKQNLINMGYAVRSVNSMLASVNSFLTFLGYDRFRVKSIRIQRTIYCEKEKELTKAEYFRLLAAAKSKPQLYLILQTICGTGIRVSELRHFSLEAIRTGEICVTCKGKNRRIFIPHKLQKLLLNFAKARHIHSGPLFCTRLGQPLSRSSIWAAMKRLCGAADVAPTKVFPHNLRKLFAKTFYTKEKDIAKLADLLGHSSINTTRIYIMTTGQEHKRKIEELGLVIT